MKSTSTILLASCAAVLCSGCFSYVRRTPDPVVVTTTSSPVVVQESVVKTLPVGYRTRVYRGTTYYEYDNVYYRSGTGGYAVVRRPW